MYWESKDYASSSEFKKVLEFLKKTLFFFCESQFSIFLRHCPWLWPNEFYKINAKKEGTDPQLCEEIEAILRHKNKRIFIHIKFYLRKTTFYQQKSTKGS